MVIDSSDVNNKKKQIQPFKLTKWYHEVFYFFGWFNVFNLLFWITLLIISHNSIHDKWFDKIRRGVYIWGMITSIFVIFILISSVLGIMFSGYNQTSTTLTYNGYKFTKETNYWSTKVDGKTVAFDYFPGEVDTISMSSDITDMIKNSVQVDFTYDIDSESKDIIALVQYNLEQTLNDNFDIYLRNGFTTENEYSFPIIKCGEESRDVPILYFTISDETSINLEGNCIVAKAKNDYDFIRIKDRILYSVFGIIE